MSEPMVVCKEVWKLFRVRDQIVKALQNVTLTVDANTTTVLRGASGSGKSTLLNLIGGLAIPTRGTVVVAGTNLSALSRSERGAFRRHAVGFVFQELVLVPHLSALENVALALAFDEKRSTALALATELLERVGLGARLDHRPAELSYGERQRVAIARAAIRSPKVILADEPTANLDDDNAERISCLLGELRDKGAAILIATHDPRLEGGADRCIRIEAGQMQLEHMAR